MCIYIYILVTVCLKQTSPCAYVSPLPSLQRSILVSCRPRHAEWPHLTRMATGFSCWPSPPGRAGLWETLGPISPLNSQEDHLSYLPTIHSFHLSYPLIENYSMAVFSYRRRFMSSSRPRSPASRTLF